MNWLAFHLLLGATALAAPQESDIKRAQQLKEFIRKEKPAFDKRETQRKGILESLDRFNVQQNQVRQRISHITLGYQELSMAMENLSMELQKERDLEAGQRVRMVALLKTLHKIRREGVVRFVAHGEDLGAIAARLRILCRTLRAHGAVSRQIAERAARLGESEKKVGTATAEVQKLLEELKEQEALLTNLLGKKNEVLTILNVKQNSYQAALREYRQVSAEVATLFDNFEASRESETSIFPNRGSLPLPIEFGRVVKNFGRSVHEKFHTVTYQKGIEIEADHNTPVVAVLPGVVEYEGWVKGLGNVVIVHHGSGFYSLCAHLFKSLKKQGEQLRQGDTLGFVGDTGSSERPSLYFEIRENGKAVDPVTYFSPQALTALR